VGGVFIMKRLYVVGDGFDIEHDMTGVEFGALHAVELVDLQPWTGVDDVALLARMQA
jgi:hypothetical protein